MEALFIYLIKSSGLIALFYFGYYFLLRQETFFNSNRWFLQLGLFTALLLPLVVFSKTVVVEASTNTSNWSKIPIATSSQNLEFEINWYLILLLTYCLGAFLFLAKFVFDFYSLNSILKGTSIRTQANYKLIDTTENIAPFSYFGTIVYNSSLYNQQELTNILAHEKIHCDQNHSVDVLISRVFCILFWFNPIVWFYKKAILQNLEFIADHQATTKIEDKKSYQITLLKITTQENCVAITNHFYQSLIKKRIVMLNKNQSKKRNSWKYAVLIPALIAFVVLFQIEVVAQEAKVETQKAANQKEEIVDSFIINKDTSDKELLENLSQLKTNYGIDGKISKVKRNSTNEIIAYKINFKKGKDISKILEIQQSTVIEPIAIVVSKTEKGLLGIEFSSSKQINNSTQQGLVVPDAPVILENEIYIDGIKTSEKKMNNIDSKDIQSIDVIKSSTKQGIRIITKKFKSANK
ncbi:hypothetical protein RCH18_003062 [Flavobacterium sp. PL11]|uniref:M56 family metallopeptidase n=1 Tax=Flavobacterium sp. PL11 TaxID=3071717 RepID=UPI002E077B64|nr:hypothetical protein [Flavobacterium sp. PL11]